MTRIETTVAKRAADASAAAARTEALEAAAREAVAALDALIGEA